MIEILRAADRRAQPWKNGGGITREVVTHPPGCGMDDFGWRLSIADVAEPGPFSRFEGVDRLIMVIEGTLLLDFGDRSVQLTPASTPFVFPGDVRCSGTPIGGAVRDLNLMTRRGRFVARADRLNGAGSTRGTQESERVLVASTTFLVETACGPVSLGPQDAIRVRGSSSLQWRGDGRLIEIMPDIAEQPNPCLKRRPGRWIR